MLLQHGGDEMHANEATRQDKLHYYSKVRTMIFFMFLSGGAFMVGGHTTTKLAGDIGAMITRLLG
jgi:hypothetical protein